MTADKPRIFVTGNFLYWLINALNRRVLIQLGVSVSGEEFDAAHRGQNSIGSPHGSGQEEGGVARRELSTSKAVSGSQKTT